MTPADYEESSVRKANWQLRGQRVVLLLPDGEEISPSATEIAGAQFSDRFTVGDCEAKGRPSDNLPGIKFNRYPIRLNLRLYPSGEVHQAFCEIEVSDERSFKSKLPELPGGHLVIDDQWYPVEPEDLSSVKGALESAGLSGPGPVSIRQFLHLATSSQCPVIIEESESSAGLPLVVEDLLPTKRRAAQIGFIGDLYPYQAVGVVWLRRMLDEGLGCILGDEMGLGKTIQIIFLLAEETEVSRKPNLVIAPATLVENWRRELERFTPALDVAVHQGGSRTGFPKTLAAHDVVLTSYDIARRDLAMLQMIEWNLAVIDEAQFIKNPDSRRSEAVKALPRRAGIAVTGTPVENSLWDLWSLMEFTCPGVLGTRENFASWNEDTFGDADVVDARVRPLLLRRELTEVHVDLPEKIYMTQAVELSSRSSRDYEELRKAAVTEYGKSGSFAVLMKLRMFCTHPFLVSNETGDPAPASTKYQRLREILAEIIHNGHKAIIFTSFTGMIDIIVSDITANYGIQCDFIDGRTPQKDRIPMTVRFNELQDPAALVLNPKAAGLGLNIAGANHVIHYNLEWNPAVEDQATARAYRIGQDRPVTVHRLFHPSTVEEVMDQRIERKRALADIAVVGTQGQGIETDDITQALNLSPENS